MISRWRKIFLHEQYKADMSPPYKILVVVPAHNEEETIYEVVSRALNYADVSVTDDGSRDRTPHILDGILEEVKKGNFRHNLHIITHPTATHIPKGIQDGITYGVERDYDYIVTMDAGLSHDPDALPEFIAYDPSVDVVIGSRINPENVPRYRMLISYLAARVVNYSLTDSYITNYHPIIRDCTSGYRRYSRKAAEALSGARLRSKAFDFHMEALAICVRSGMKAAEIPIRYVFSNSSFNVKVLKYGIMFGMRLLATKKNGI